MKFRVNVAAGSFTRAIIIIILYLILEQSLLIKNSGYFLYLLGFHCNIRDPKMPLLFYCYIRVPKIPLIVYWFSILIFKDTS